MAAPNFLFSLSGLNIMRMFHIQTRAACCATITVIIDDLLVFAGITVSRPMLFLVAFTKVQNLLLLMPSIHASLDCNFSEEM